MVPGSYNQPYATPSLVIRKDLEASNIRIIYQWRFDSKLLLLIFMGMCVLYLHTKIVVKLIFSWYQNFDIPLPYSVLYFVIYAKIPEIYFFVNLKSFLRVMVKRIPNSSVI